MQILFVVAILCYLLSSAGYFTYLIFQREILQRLGIGLLLAGFICQTIVLIGDFIALGHMPVNNLHETLSLVAWTLAGAFLALSLKLQVKLLGLYVAPLAAFVSIVANQFPSDLLQPQNLMQGFWLWVHIIAVFLGNAAFTLACSVGTLYLIQEHSIKSKSHGFFFKRLPSLDLLDSTGYACIVTGFTMLTVGLVTGMMYAKNVWGRFWSWDPKEIWSAITWIFYAVLLHERLAVGWRGRRAAIMAIAGFFVLTFTFLGVNFLLKGHHGQFTRW
jgi:cytochrome c-type biogenesis protein CcsB